MPTVNTSGPTNFNGVISKVIKVTDVNGHSHTVDMEEIGRHIRFNPGSAGYYDSSAYKIIGLNESYTLPYTSKIVISGTGYDFSYVYINGTTVPGSGYSYGASYNGTYTFNAGTTVKITGRSNLSNIKGTIYRYHEPVQAGITIV